MNKRKVEVFSAGCPACAETVKLIQEYRRLFLRSRGAGHEQLEVATKARQYGVKTVPAVAINGKLQVVTAAGPNRGGTEECRPWRRCVRREIAGPGSKMSASAGFASSRANISHLLPGPAWKPSLADSTPRGLIRGLGGAHWADRSRLHDPLTNGIVTLFMGCWWIGLQGAFLLASLMAFIALSPPSLRTRRS